MGFRISEGDCGPAVHLKVCVHCRPTVLQGEYSECLWRLSPTPPSLSNMASFTPLPKDLFSVAKRCEHGCVQTDVPSWYLETQNLYTRPVATQTNDAFDARCNNSRTLKQVRLPLLEPFFFNHLLPISCETFVKLCRVKLY